MQRDTASAVMRVLMVCDAVIFFVAAAFHQGVRLTAGPVVLALGHIPDATIAEGSIGIAYAVAAYALFALLPWRRGAALFAHVYALLGVLVGVSIIAASSSGYKALNLGYHAAMLVLILTGLVILWEQGRQDVARPRRHTTAKTMKGLR
jgi:hypothetical protein